LILIYKKRRGYGRDNQDKANEKYSIKSQQTFSHPWEGISQ